MSLGGNQLADNHQFESAKEGLPCTRGGGGGLRGGDVRG